MDGTSIRHAQLPLSTLKRLKMTTLQMFSVGLALILVFNPIIGSLQELKKRIIAGDDQNATVLFKQNLEQRQNGVIPILYTVGYRVPGKFHKTNNHFHF